MTDRRCQPLKLPDWRRASPGTLGVLAGLCVFVAACLSGATLYVRSVAALRGEVQRNLIRTAKVAATVIDADQIGRAHV